MLLLKQNLADSTFNTQKKRLVWMAAAFAFAGSLRSSEYLCPAADSFDPMSTLLIQDVKLETFSVDTSHDTQAVTMLIKEPKELSASKSRVTLELFENFTFLCPVEAFLKYKQTIRKRGINPDQSQPLFQLYENGTWKGYTRSMFNKDIKFLLEKDVDYTKEKLLSHSFRAGLATTMARSGFDQEHIMLVGRWSSDAFRRYLKQGRSTRFSTMKAISDSVSKMAKGWTPGTLML